MKRLYAVAAAAVAVAVVVGCSSSTSPTNNGPHATVITIGPQVIVSVDTVASSICTKQVVSDRPMAAQCTISYYTDTIWCNTFNPNPASAATGQDVEWFNNSGGDLTVFQVSSGTPIATIQAGATSNPVYWSQAGTIAYTVSSCGITGYNPDYQPEKAKIPQETIYITTS